MKLRELIKTLGPVALVHNICIVLPDDMKIYLGYNHEYFRGFRILVTAIHDGEMLDEEYWERIDWDARRKFCGIDLNSEEWTITDVDDINEAVIAVQSAWDKICGLITGCSK